MFLRTQSSIQFPVLWIFPLTERMSTPSPAPAISSENVLSDPSSSSLLTTLSAVPYSTCASTMSPLFHPGYAFGSSTRRNRSSRYIRRDSMANKSPSTSTLNNLSVSSGSSPSPSISSAPSDQQSQSVASPSFGTSASPPIQTNPVPAFKPASFSTSASPPIQTNPVPAFKPASFSTSASPPIQTNPVPAFKPASFSTSASPTCLLYTSPSPRD